MPYHFRNPQEILRSVTKYWRPPPDLSISEWADKYRRLSSKSSAEAGKWRTNRTPYLKEIMDSVKETEKIIWMAGAQLGKTELLLNIKGYYMHLDPCPVLEVQPTLEMAGIVSKDRISPMIEECPQLKDLIGEKRSKDSENTILHKSFPGGSLSLCGANSPASLASRPIRVVLCDEVDRYPFSAGTEGDPVSLAIKRTTNFWNRKIIITSTPTIKGASRIEFEYELSDKRKFFIPCPHCGEKQILSWKQFKWTSVKTAQAEICDEAWHECLKCGGRLYDSHKTEALAKGEWRPTGRGKIRGYHLWQAYSPWKLFSQIVQDFLDCKGDRQKLKTFSNTVLGEPYDDIGGEGLSWQSLLARSEPYALLSIPQKAFILTAGVDVQSNRLAISLWAWGRGEEAWLIYHNEIFGDPTGDQVWKELDLILESSYSHDSGKDMQIVASCIDSSYATQSVYNFVRTRPKSFAIKGISKENSPIISRPSAQDFNYKGTVIKQGAKLWPVGVDTAKVLIYQRLRQVPPGFGCFHFPLGVDQEYFEQLTSEKLVTKFSGQRARRLWVKTRSRNESLDCLVYSYAAAYLAGISRMNWDKLELQWTKKIDPAELEEEFTPPSKQKRWGNSWGEGLVENW